MSRKTIRTVWERVVTPLKDAFDVPMVPEYDEAPRRESQSRHYSNTY